jgi:hypothetical protein
MGNGFMQSTELLNVKVFFIVGPFESLNLKKDNILTSSLFDFLALGTDFVEFRLFSPAPLNEDDISFALSLIHLIPVRSVFVV